jgi:hypothetical protein
MLLFFSLFPSPFSLAGSLPRPSGEAECGKTQHALGHDVASTWMPFEQLSVRLDLLRWRERRRSRLSRPRSIGAWFGGRWNPPCEERKHLGAAARALLVSVDLLAIQAQAGYV